MKRGEKTIKCLSIIQINLLFLSIIAFSFIIGLTNIKVVSAESCGVDEWIR